MPAIPAGMNMYNFSPTCNKSVSELLHVKKFAPAPGRHPENSRPWDAQTAGKTKTQFISGALQN